MEIPADTGDGSQPTFLRATRDRTSGDELADLMERAAHGHEEAFVQLYDATSAHVHGLILQILRSPDHAVEVTQEVYLEAWQHAVRYDHRLGSVMAWVITMAHRRAVDRVRSVTRSINRDQLWALRHHEQPHDEAWETVEHGLDSTLVRKGLKRLTMIQREAITLVYFGGHTSAEVATMLDLPVGTVKTRLRDGLIRLRDAVGDRRQPV